MNEKETNKNEIQGLKTPLDIMLRMAESEIKDHVIECMSLNAIPPALMFYLLKSIALDICEMKDKYLSNDFCELQKKIVEKQEG